MQLSNSPYNSIEAVWIKDDGELIDVSDMSSAHMLNCIKYILSGRMKRQGCCGFDNEQWVEIFEAELARRCAIWDVSSMAEQVTHNRLATGSIPVRPTFLVPVYVRSSVEERRSPKPEALVRLQPDVP